MIIFLTILFVLLLLISFTSFIIFFNRPPPRIDSKFGLNDVVSPADGTIKYIQNRVIDGRKYKMIHIYIGLTNIHTQVYPTDGLLTSATYFPTKVFNDARGNTDKNEKLDTYLDNGIIIRQIAGILARRIHAFDPVGTFVKRSEHLGKITLGSGCEVFLPEDLFRLSKDIIPGRDVKVGETTLAERVV